MVPWTGWSSSLVFALLMCLLPQTVAPEETVAGVSSVTIDVLNARIEEVNATVDLDEATKGKITELFRKAASSLERARSQDATAASFEEATLKAPAETKLLRDQLQGETPDSVELILSVSEESELGEIESQLLAAKNGQTSLAATSSALEDQLSDQISRSNVARQRITDIRGLLDDINRQRKLPPGEDETPLMYEARDWALETERLSLTSEARMLEQELLSQPVRVELLKARMDETALNLAQTKRRVDLLEELVNQRRRADAEQAQAEAEVARVKAERKHPTLREAAETNAALTTALWELAESLERVTGQQDRIDDHAEKIERSFQTTTKKLEIAGLNYALGQVLLTELQKLPDTDRIREEGKIREQRIAESGLRHIQYDEDRRTLADIERYLSSLMSDLDASDAATIRSELLALLTKRHDLLDQALSTEETYQRALAELDFENTRLLAATEAYEEFLAEHLLWIRSTPALNMRQLRGLPAEISVLLVPAAWQALSEALLRPDPSSLLWVLGLLVIGAWMWKRRHLVQMIAATAENVARPSIDRIGASFEALGLSFLLALPGPLLVAIVGWRLSISAATTELGAALGPALLWIAPRFLLLSTLRALCLPDGLASGHFRWRKQTVISLRQGLDRLMFVFLPAAFLAAFLVAYDPIDVGGTLGKLFIVLSLMGLSWFFYQLLHPGKGLLHGYLIKNQTDVLYRLRYLYFPLVVALPGLLAGLALAGYVYTAATLFDSLLQSFALVFILVVLHQLALRWLRVTRLRLAFQAAMERREAARTSAKSSQRDRASAEGPTRDRIEVDEPEVDLHALSENTHELINLGFLAVAIVGFWWIWSDVFPAFGILESVSLWNHTTLVDGQEVLEPITLASLLLAVVIGGVAYVAATRLPALLEMVLLERTSMESGSRNAISTLSGYFIASVGALLTFNIIGADWSKLQWLVAAMGVGIGFGLQEIVANFICGLIILFERPVRVGDIVTVGDTSGVVSRIRIRATTVTNWDRKELLVPNKEFITGRLLNWSLSDPTTRIVITVGIAYGSDVDLALKLLMEAADEHERVFKEPKPKVTFETFADSALTLVLRCFVGSVENRVDTLSDLNRSINRKFNAAGISIAFPQMDVHLDANGPLNVSLRGSPGSA